MLTDFFFGAGLARQDISVTVNDDVLRITGQEKDHAAEDNASSHLLVSASPAAYKYPAAL